MHAPWIALAGVSGFVAVAAGAFGAHALQDRLSPAMLAVFEVGVRYHFWHTLALLYVGWTSADDRPGGRWLAVAGWCFVGGIVVFSGSLYALALTGARWLGAITPIGGVAFLAGWAVVAASGWRSLVRR